MEPLATPAQYLLIVSLIACALALLIPLAVWLDDGDGVAKLKALWRRLPFWFGLGATAWEFQVGRFQVNINRRGYWRGQLRHGYLPIKFFWWAPHHSDLPPREWRPRWRLQ